MPSTPPPTYTTMPTAQRPAAVEPARVMAPLPTLRAGAAPPAYRLLDAVAPTIPRAAAAPPVAAVMAARPIVPVVPVVPVAVAARPYDAILVRPGRAAPQLIPTQLVHRGIVGAQEQARIRNVERMMQRITLADARLTPEYKTDAIIDWLVQNEFMVRSRGRASQVVQKFYGHDTVKSRLFDNHGVDITRNMPWLKKDQVAIVRAMLIDRAHANLADSRTTMPSARAALVRYFTLVKDKKPLQPLAQVSASIDGPNLTRLSALHTEDIYFDQAQPLAEGGEGQFFVGVTRSGVPVGVKRFLEDGTHEAAAMRGLQVGGYLQCHHNLPPASHSLVVMPCYSGTLLDFAKPFLEVATTPRLGDAGGLVGTRYVAWHIFDRLDVLHREMRGVHSDIKDINIFASQPQKRFVLSDFGMSGKMSAEGEAIHLGFTGGYASPEQVLKQKTITAASDIFSACITTVNSLLRDDPTVRRAWRRTFARKPRPVTLFPGSDDKIFPAMTAWSHFIAGRTDPQANDITARLVCPPEAWTVEAKYTTRFLQLDQVMRQVDEPLWEALKRGLHPNPIMRPQAEALRDDIALNAEDWTKCDAVWAQLPPFNEPIAAELKRLRPMVDGLRR